MNERNELIERKESLPVICDVEDLGAEREEIRVFEKTRKADIINVLAIYWRFAALVAAFAAIFFLLYSVFAEDVPLPDAEAQLPQESEFQTSEETPALTVEASAPVLPSPPVLIDEARSEISIDDYFNGNVDLVNLFKIDGDIKVLVIHSHPSERVSQNMTATDAGEVIVQLLSAAGIGAMHCTVMHDENGRIGAYERMKESIVEIKKDKPSLVLIIDLHGSESDKPFLFDIGVSSDYAWKENLRISSAIYYNMDRNDCTVRLLPHNLGQNNGVLTIGVSLGHESADDSFARELIADLALGITLLFNENTPE